MPDPSHMNADRRPTADPGDRVRQAVLAEGIRAANAELPGSRAALPKGTLSRPNPGADGDQNMTPAAPPGTGADNPAMIERPDRPGRR